ncbi:MAG: T9SS type A sorting domain-containing protein [Chitinophagales bacterium]|nr:T9SS type A sorting domain-containing protein [Chitinophagales bacterium]MCZ2393526.1 T9SS type A sorting domain-containing protein [Chitinophagales bacterium]
MRIYLIISLLVAGLFNAQAQIAGCRDPKAGNYNKDATVNDGSCVYSNVFHLPRKIVNLPSAVSETSGLFLWNEFLWTFNDSGGEAALYALDPNTGSVMHKLIVAGAANYDWEDIAVDDNFVYIGDIGNNNGNRRDLKIYKFPIEDLEKDTAHAIAIHFSYEDQVDFTTNPNKNDYDAEALVSIGDSLYIFSKNWVNSRCRIYALDKNQENQEAKLLNEFFSNGMITGADFQPLDQVLVLCGYNALLQPFIWLLWDFPNHDIWAGNKRRINLNLPFHQIEGVAWAGGSNYLLTNEELKQVVNVNAALFSLDMSPWVDATNIYIYVTSNANSNEEKGFEIFPNPVNGFLNVQWESSKSIHSIEVYDMKGSQSEVWMLPLHQNQSQLNLSHYLPGTYILVLVGDTGRYVKKFEVK